MRALLTLLLTAIVLSTTSCASNTVEYQAAPSADKVQPAATKGADSQPNATPMPALAEAGNLDATGVPSKAQLDAEAIYAQVLVHDHLEGFNRRMHGFNNVADKLVLRPLAVGYDKITPEPIQAGVSRFFANLRMPATAVNQALQGRPGDAGRSLGRFTLNTTVGIAGVFDPASHFGMPKRDDEDFGQTLATWGWRDSRYLVLPLLGPRTVRDALGIIGDRPLSPIGQVQDSGAASGLQLMEIVNVRTRMLPIDKFRREAFDDYIFVRDAWAQRRNNQIQQDLRSDRD
jgi:phospholipid-binding lipoprotein MlaA